MIDTSSFTDQQRITFYREHVQNWRDSGLNKAAYCREHGLKTYNLHYWGQKFAAQEVHEKSEPTSPKSRLRVLPLQQPHQTLQQEQSAGIEIQFSECRIVLKGAVDETSLCTVLRALRGSTCGA